MLMEKKNRKGFYVFVSVFVVVLLVLLAKVIFDSANTPPDLRRVQAVFDENREEIQLVTTYLMESGYDSVYISDSGQRIMADFSPLTISDSDVSDAIRKLFASGKYKQINKIGGTVVFLQWTGPCDIGCGALFSRNLEESIEDQWLTTVCPMEDAQWFYYVSDYNAWKSGVRALVEFADG